MKNKIPIVFSGSSNKPLAFSIAKHLGGKSGNVKICKFPSQEIRARINENVTDKMAIVVQSLNYPSEHHFFELALLIDALKHLRPARVIGVIPWLAYSLQDERFLEGEPVSAEVIAKCIDSLQLDLLVFVDLHSNKVKSYFETPNIHISHAEVFQNQMKKIEPGGLTVIAPDEGASERTKAVAKMLKANLIQLNKVRDLQTGRIKYASHKINIQGRRCLLCDDVIITGNTLVDAASILDKYGAKSVIAFCTHPILANDCLEKIEKSKIEKLVVSNTILLPEKKKLEKLKQINVAPVISDKIRKHLQKLTRNTGSFHPT